MAFSWQLCFYRVSWSAGDKASHPSLLLAHVASVIYTSFMVLVKEPFIYAVEANVTYRFQAASVRQYYCPAVSTALPRGLSIEVVKELCTVQMPAEDMWRKQDNSLCYHK